MTFCCFSSRSGHLESTWRSQRSERASLHHSDVRKHRASRYRFGFSSHHGRPGFHEFHGNRYRRCCDNPRQDFRRPPDDCSRLQRRRPGGEDYRSIRKSSERTTGQFHIYRRRQRESIERQHRVQRANSNDSDHRNVPGANSVTAASGSRTSVTFTVNTTSFRPPRLPCSLELRRVPRWNTAAANALVVKVTGAGNAVVAGATVVFTVNPNGAAVLSTPSSTDAGMPFGDGDDGYYRAGVYGNPQ